MTDLIKTAQTELKKRGLYAGKIDGVIGPKTTAALDTIKGINKIWEPERKAVAFIQILCAENKIETGSIDGIFGPKTQGAYDKLVAFLDTGELPAPWRDDASGSVVIHPGKTVFPLQNYADLVLYYGEVGTNQKKLQLPYLHYLSWDKKTSINNFSCHNKVHDSLGRILNRVLAEYGQKEISRLGLDVWGGCLSVRQIRGGTGYSMHSWGIAVDYDPENNQLKWGSDKAVFAKSEYETWWKIWEDEGWVSLGRAKNYDWMHVQAARLK